MKEEIEDPSLQFLSENIEESPQKGEPRIPEDFGSTCKIPEFPYNESNMKRKQLGMLRPIKVKEPEAQEEQVEDFVSAPSL